MTRPRSLSERDLALINLYANCQLGLSPRRFYAKWEVSHEAIAQICSRSPSKVRVRLEEQLRRYSDQGDHSANGGNFQ